MPRPDQIVLASLCASPRCEDSAKPIVDTLQTRPAARIKGVHLAQSYLFLECELERMVDDFGENSLVVGRIGRDVRRRGQQGVDTSEERRRSHARLYQPYCR